MLTQTILEEQMKTKPKTVSRISKLIPCVSFEIKPIWKQWKSGVDHIRTTLRS